MQHSHHRTPRPRRRRHRWIHQTCRRRTCCRCRRTCHRQTCHQTCRRYRSSSQFQHQVGWEFRRRGRSLRLHVRRCSKTSHDRGILTVLLDALLDTVAVGNSVTLGSATLVAIADTVVEVGQVALVGAGDLFEWVSIMCRVGTVDRRHLRECSGRCS